MLKKLFAKKNKKSTKFILDSNQYSARGDTINARQIHLALRKYLSIDSILTYEANNQNNSYQALERLHNENIPMFAYSSLSDLHEYAEKKFISHSYLVNNGEYSPKWVKGTKNCIHAVFNNFHPYGDVYAYVSEWLYNQQLQKKTIDWPIDLFRDIQKSSKSPYFPNKEMKINWVPHIVNPSKPNHPNYFREAMGIPTNSKIIGRIGGLNEFDDPDAQEVVKKICKENPGIFFIFINTNKFYEHAQIRYLNGYISETEKSNFYVNCDLTLNGRLHGESFGFSICESLYFGIPVIAPNQSRNSSMDGHHIDLLSPLDLLYSNSYELEEKIFQIIESPNLINQDDLFQTVQQFAPEKVIERFYEVFIK